jgi:hypothetical protein
MNVSLLQHTNGFHSSHGSEVSFYCTIGEVLREFNLITVSPNFMEFTQFAPQGNTDCSTETWARHEFGKALGVTMLRHPQV